MAAQQSGIQAMITLLLEQGADPTIVYDRNLTPIAYASENNQVIVVELIARYKKNDAEDKLRLDCLLCQAANRDNSCVLARALLKSWNTHKKEVLWYDGKTLLEIAVDRDNQAIGRITDRVL